MAKVRVLVVDDSPDVLDATKDLLTAHGYEVETAENGATAMTKYFTFKPDLVTLDLAMPVMDGYETLSRLLRMDKDAKIVMATAMEHEALLKKCMENGALGYLLKPFTAEQLLSTITNAFKPQYNKRITLLFNLASRKIESSIQNILGADASLVLQEVAVVQQLRSAPEIKLPQLEPMPNVVEPVEIEAPPDSLGYINEIGGLQNCMIVSFMQYKDVQKLTGDSNIKGGQAIVEFFSIINLKVFSGLANTTQMMLNISPTRLYDRARDKSAYGTDVAKAKFTIIRGSESIPFEIQLHVKLSQILGRMV